MKNEERNFSKTVEAHDTQAGAAFFSWSLELCNEISQKNNSFFDMFIMNNSFLHFDE